MSGCEVRADCFLRPPIHSYSLPLYLLDWLHIPLLGSGGWSHQEETSVRSMPVRLQQFGRQKVQYPSTLTILVRRWSL